MTGVPLANTTAIGLSKETLAETYRHASACYPEECCGFVTRSGRVHACVNNQNALHAADPQRHPRDASEAYSFTFEGLRALERSLASDDLATIIYHSHPDVGAYFSRTDRDRALLNGHLIYPVDFLVIDVRNDGVCGAKLFRFDGKEFVSMSFEDR